MCSQWEKGRDSSPGIRENQSKVWFGLQNILGCSQKGAVNWLATLHESPSSLKIRVQHLLPMHLVSPELALNTRILVLHIRQQRCKHDQESGLELDYLSQAKSHCFCLFGKII